MFPALNRGDVKDTEMEAIMDSLVDSLFSVFVTAGTIVLFYECNVSPLINHMGVKSNYIISC